jgi:hypothetical protein
MSTIFLSISHQSFVRPHWSFYGHISSFLGTHHSFFRVKSVLFESTPLILGPHRSFSSDMFFLRPRVSVSVHIDFLEPNRSCLRQHRSFFGAISVLFGPYRYYLVSYRLFLGPQAYFLPNCHAEDTMIRGHTKYF